MILLQHDTLYPEVPELLRFKKLLTRLSEVMLDVLHSCIEPTESMIKSLVNVEDGYINLYHPEVLTGTTAILGVMQPQKGNIKQEKLEATVRQKEEERKLKEMQLRKEEEAQKERQKKQGGFFSKIFGSSTPSSEEKKEDKKSELFPGKNKSDLLSSYSTDKVSVLKSLPDIMRADNPASSREIVETEIIKQLLKSYLKVVKKNIVDLVPKAIMTFLVNKSKSTAQNELVTALYSEKAIPELMEENPVVMAKRSDCRKTIEVLSESLKALNEITDLDI